MLAMGKKRWKTSCPQDADNLVQEMHLPIDNTVDMAKLEGCAKGCNRGQSGRFPRANKKTAPAKWHMQV